MVAVHLTSKGDRLLHVISVTEKGLGQLQDGERSLLDVTVLRFILLRVGFVISVRLRC